jgi:hypothetical protein
MNVKPAVAVAAILAFNGCGVGIVSVRAPKRLPAEGLPPLTERVSFDVCHPGRLYWAGAIREALARAGVETDLVSEPGMPAHFTVTPLDRAYAYEWSMMLSFLTLSIVPGYLAERYNVEVDIALRNPGKGGAREHLVYERGVDGFFWAPFIVYPDTFGSINGGWDSTRYQEIQKKGDMVGFEETIQRLADDLRIRFGRRGLESTTTEAVGVTCPSAGNGK